MNLRQELHVPRRLQEFYTSREENQRQHADNSQGYELILIAVEELHSGVNQPADAQNGKEDSKDLFGVHSGTWLDRGGSQVSVQKNLNGMRAKLIGCFQIPPISIRYS